MSYSVIFEISCDDQLELYFTLDSPCDSVDSAAWTQLKHHYEKMYNVKLSVEFLQHMFDMNEPDQLVECDVCKCEILYSESNGSDCEIFCNECYDV